jgi:hypothetical protein
MVQVQVQQVQQEVQVHQQALMVQMALMVLWLEVIGFQDLPEQMVEMELLVVEEEEVVVVVGVRMGEMMMSEGAEAEVEVEDLVVQAVQVAQGVVVPLLFF